MPNPINKLTGPAKKHAADARAHFDALLKQRDGLDKQAVELAEMLDQATKALANESGANVDAMTAIFATQERIRDNQEMVTHRKTKLAAEISNAKNSLARIKIQAEQHTGWISNCQQEIKALEQRIVHHEKCLAGDKDSVLPKAGPIIYKLQSQINSLAGRLAEVASDAK